MPFPLAFFNRVRTMSKLRSLIVWSVVFTQAWAPVLAQTLPISVDRSCLLYTSRCV